jgi:4-methyl-5(b-hydroxyethyl)-thiazole monophosphate biosynthesis
MKKVFLFLANGFEEIEAITTIDILRRAGITVITISIDSFEKRVTGAHGITIEADALIYDTDFSLGDMLVLPGGIPGATNLRDCPTLNKLIVDYDEKGKYLAAICAAPLVFGTLGLLKNKEAVCYPGYEKELQGASVLDKPVVLSDNIITAKAAGCTVEFALTLVELLKSKKIADNIAAQIFFEKIL